MTILRPKTIVVLGMMTKMPVAGVVWQVAHYLVGLRRLGFDVYYVEAHAGTPAMLMTSEEDDGSALAAAFIDSVCRRFDLADKWAFHALHEDGVTRPHRVYGLGESRLMELYNSADAIINLHGGTLPREEHTKTGRLVYLETDPVEVEIAEAQGDKATIEYLAQHNAFFTFGENLGRPTCRLPVSERFRFLPTRQPVVVDFWQKLGIAPGAAFTTVGNWEQQWRSIKFNGETYHWSKHLEYLKFLDLPKKTAQPLELALSSYSEKDRAMLQERGWRVRHAMEFSTDADEYRRYIAASRGEFTVAKDQNVRLRSGWFSDRSATYLAAGRPVVTQETGFSDGILPTGEGLFGFSTMDEITQAFERINSDYEQHCRAAARIAAEYFDAGKVLGAMVRELGL